MTTALSTNNGTANSEKAVALEKVLLGGDLASLSEAERLVYYRALCDSLELNHLSRPFEYIVLDGKLTLYARKDATEQLRNKKNVSVQITARERMNDLYLVTARATMPDGRTDESIGVVPLVKEGGEWTQSSNGKRYFKGNGTFIPLSGVDLANAIMKCESKAKRRVTLSICGLGILDETELDTIPSARPFVPRVTEEAPPPALPTLQQAKPTSTVKADVRTGEIIEPKQNGRVTIPGLGDTLEATYREVVGDDAPLPDEDPDFFPQVQPEPQQNVRMASEKQIKAIFAISRSKGLDAKALTQEKFGCNPDELTLSQASSIMDEFNKDRR